MQSADATGARLRCSEPSVRALRAQTGLERLWVELAVRSLGLSVDGSVPLRLKEAQPSWGRIAALLLESGQPF